MNRGPTGRSWPRRWIERLVLLAVAVVVCRTWYVQGLFVPVRVEGGSMAGTLVGRHREVRCADCGYRFDCQVSGARRVRAVCPNCGFADNRVAGLPAVDGDRVLVSRSVYSLRPPSRWEVVALHEVGRESRLCVKRVVGLPGEAVQVRHGDVYVDGKVERKSLAVQRRLALLVYDADLPPGGDPPPKPRWRDEQVGTGWGEFDGRFAHPAVPGRSRVDWLTFHHLVRPAASGGEPTEVPLANRHAYNQDRPRRPEETRPVADVLLSFRIVRTFGQGALLVRATDGGEEFLLEIDPTQASYRVTRNGKAADPPCEGDLPEDLAGHRVEVSLFDRQLLVALDGKPVARWPFEGTPPPEGTSRPFAFGSKGLGLEIQDVKVFRDVYYTHPAGPHGRWGLQKPVQLGRDEYFVLGDNSAISEDSRTWEVGPGVPRAYLLGKPFLVHFPSRPVKIGPWKIQVPDPAEIRYIR